MKLADAYVRESRALGHSCELQDLYRMGFNPVLASGELDPGAVAAPDVALAQRAVASCDVLAVAYPLWWASMPAMLKGYIDRVFARGFAYEGHSGGTRGLLNGRVCILMTLSGSPLQMMMENGEWHAIQTLQDAHIFRSSGLRVLEHLHFDLVEPPIPQDHMDAYVRRVQASIRRHF